jgi:hypothetical protein
MSDSITYIPVIDLRVTHDNPRFIDKVDLEKLKISISNDPKFLELRPILVSQVNGLNIVYAGAQRLKACTELGMKTVPCFVTPNIPKEVLQKRMLLDNVHSGVWELKGDNLTEFSGIGTLEGDRFQFDSEILDTDLDITEEEKSKIKRVGAVYLELEFSSFENYQSFLLLMESLRESDPDSSVPQRLLNYIKALHGGSRGKAK